MIKKKDFIDKKLELMCRICAKRTKVKDDLNQKLPDEGTLDEMLEVFNEVMRGII